MASDKGLSPNWWQAVVYTDDGLVNWCILHHWAWMSEWYLCQKRWSGNGYSDPFYFSAAPGKLNPPQCSNLRQVQRCDTNQFSRLVSLFQDFPYHFLCKLFLTYLQDWQLLGLSLNTDLLYNLVQNNFHLWTWLTCLSNIYMFIFS